MKHAMGNRAHVTKPHVKERYRAFFLALQTDARHYIGGVPELANQLDRNYGPLRNALCPTVLNAEPTLETVLEIAEIAGASRAAQAFARLTGMTAIPMPHNGNGGPAEVVTAFMGLVKEAGRVNERTAEALEDGRLDVQERLEVGDYLDALIASAVEMRALVRG